MPMVMFDGVIDEINCDKVIIDDVIGAKEAVQHLIDINCRNIALISTVDYVSVGKLRTQGYFEALTANEMEINPNLILTIEDFDNSEQEIKRYLKGKKVNGVFAVNEHFAI